MSYTRYILFKAYKILDYFSKKFWDVMTLVRIIINHKYSQIILYIFGACTILFSLYALYIALV